MRRQRREGRVALKPHHSRRPKYDGIERRQMANIQKDNQQWTYDQVRAAWKEWWSREHVGMTAPTPSNYTLNSVFNEFDITSKNLEWVPEVRNDAHHIEWRKKYSQEAVTWNRENLIFIDEIGFTMHVHRRRGRSVRGTRAHANEKNSPGNRINMCAAVSPVQGLVKYRCILTTWDSKEFANFMKELLDAPLLQTRSCLICMDNVSWHHVEQVHDVLWAGRIQHHIKRIPAYSPQLNPIEYAFSVWKNAIKRVDQVTTTIPLQSQIDNAAPLITDHLITRCLDHVYRYYLHCMQGKPLEAFNARLEEVGEGKEEVREGKEEKEEKYPVDEEDME
jgi:transposase